MRVANKSVFDVTKFQLANITEELNKANRVISTGKRINELSDDPVGVTQVLDIKATLSSIEQLQRNISLGNSWLTASESALNQTQDIVSDMKALAVEMANSTKDASQRSSAAQVVQNMLEEIVALANTDVSGRYIFAGTKTDSAPFDQTGTYSGNNDPFSIKISKDSSIAIGSDGQAVFSSLFTRLSAFKTALENDDVDGIKTAITDLDTDFDTITSKVSDIGSKMLRMEVKDNLLQNISISNTDRLSAIEDADIAQAIMDLSTIKFTYQAALSSSAKVLTLSLVDYLK